VEAHAVLADPWKMSFLTPHMAGASNNLLEHRRALNTANIRRFTPGLPLLNLVDKAKGY
jgi:phosphoglycerate dehydrogenase-like enzyme